MFFVVEMSCIDTMYTLAYVPYKHKLFIIGSHNNTKPINNIFYCDLLKALSSIIKNEITVKIILQNFMSYLSPVLLFLDWFGSTKTITHTFRNISYFCYRLLLHLFRSHVECKFVLKLDIMCSN